MIPDVLQELTWLKKCPKMLKGIQRGLERETLRINNDGRLATTKHPQELGSSLTHKWITTDFSEALLEFITPVDEDISHMLSTLRDIHRYTARNLKNEYMWPLSMPCHISNNQEIKLAQYGTSNIGKLKTLYREGLRNRYGPLMQIISGVHYNFSMPIDFWKEKCGKVDKEVISSGYFQLIRNYYRFGWVIPYLFGSSPAVSTSFLKNQLTNLPLKRSTCGSMYYLPYSTSLRLSELGYSNNLSSNLGITFNVLHEYIEKLKKAIKTPSKTYQKIGLKKNGKRLQINDNILQIESEFYSLIRPKRVLIGNETPSDALQRGGVEYIEVRSLDINSFSPIGIDEQQVRFLDLFMLWCILADAPKMSSDELLCTYTNWNRVILEGRKPGLSLKIGHETIKYPLLKVGKSLFQNLKYIAQILDYVFGNEEYQKVCDRLTVYFDNPELTFSARILRFMINHGINKTGRILAEKYFNILSNEPFEILKEEDFVKERKKSFLQQRKIELSDKETFESFLKRKNF